MINLNDSLNLVDLDVEKLFEDYSIIDIIQIEKMFDLEIEKKRSELRGMVGDRYRDVLTASVAIKYMKNISETIVDNIGKIMDRCEELIAGTSEEFKNTPRVIDLNTSNERVIIMQMRLLIAIISHIWRKLDTDEFLKAAQLYLLAQHIHTGLQLLGNEVLSRLSIFQRLKSDTDVLRCRILMQTTEKLKAINLNAEETSSNLNALILLEQYENDTDLFKVFITLRKDALTRVISEPHASVRLQVTTMIKCLITTVLLLQECFVNFENSKRGLIWQKLESIVGENASYTLSEIELPSTSLIVYIPDIIKVFRPKCDHTKFRSLIKKMPGIIDSWLSETSEDIGNSMKKSLELVTTIKGLHIIREEALKIETPTNWATVCSDTTLPSNFHIWFYFFQKLLTNRAKALITLKINTISTNLQENLTKTLDGAFRSEINECDLRCYTWKEEDCDISRTENNHIGLSMKAKGFSSNIRKLCLYCDEMYSDLWQDIRLYLYGIEEREISHTKERVHNKRYIDKNELEEHLQLECYNNALNLTKFVDDLLLLETNTKECVMKSLVCARFLQAVCELCPNFYECFSCDGRTSEWEKICSHFQTTSLRFWNNWVLYCLHETKSITSDLGKSTALDLIHILPKWDTVEIQEQTEEKVFESLIKVPSQPSICLQNILTGISNQFSTIITHTLPKQVHLQFIEKHMEAILEQYLILAGLDLNQTQALQFLFDVKFITTLSIPRENIQLITKSQNICDSLRSKVDPFDLDVFYSYLQNNVKTCVVQSQVILGCFLPNPGQLASIGMLEKNKDIEKDPSVLAVCVPSTTSWFPLLPVTTPTQKVAQSATAAQNNFKARNTKPSEKRKINSGASVRSGAAAFFGAMTNDWFS